MARTVEEAMDGYDLLRCAICKQAVLDYRKALKDLENTKKGKRQIMQDGA